MKKFLLFISFCLMATVYNVASAAEEVLWSEDFSTYKANAVPKGGTYNYACADNGTNKTMIYTANMAGGTSPELLIGKKGGKFSATIPINGISGELTLTFKSNKNVTVSATNATIGTKTTSSNLYTYPVTVKEGTESITLIFSNTSSENYRFDDVKLVKIIEEPATAVAKPTTTAAADKMLYGAEFTISTTTEGAHILYNLDGSDSYTSVESNTVPLKAPTEGESFTIKAYAVDPTGALSQSETLLVENIALYSNGVASIKAFLDAADTSEEKTFTNPVTAIYQNGKNLWVKDDSGYLLVYGTLDVKYAEGDVIPAGFSGLYKPYSGLPELQNPTGFKASTENKGAVTPVEVTVEELLAVGDLNTYVSIKNAKFDGSSFSDDDTNSIKLDTKNSAVTLATGKTYNITGFYSIYNGTYQITVIKAVEKQLVADLEITPAFGDIIIGETITISCATEGATIAVGEISGGAETIDLSGKTFPYTYTIKEEDLDKTLKVEAYASLADYLDSPVLTGNYTVIAPTPAEAVFTNEAGEEVTGGDVKQGSYIKFSWESGCSAEVDINGTVTNYDAESTFGTWSVDDTYKAGDKVTISVKVTNKYNKTSTATATFTVVSPYKVVDVITVNDNPGCKAYQNFSKVVKGGAVYAGRFMDGSGTIQINGSTSGSAAGSGVFMTNSVGNVSKVSVEWNSKTTSGRTLNIYGKNEPYVAYASDAEADCKTYVGTNNTARGTKLGTIVCGTSTEFTIDGDYKYIFVQVATSNAVYLNSITFEWEDAFEYGKDITYEMQSETTKLTEGKFVTLVDATNKIAVSRNNAAEGTIAGAAASIAEADENSKTSLTLGKGQFSIDEFELVPVIGGGFKLYGGGTITRRYIGVDATGLTTTTDEKDAAVVTLESDGTGVVVKFDDKQIIVSDGTNFGKGTASTESAASLAEGKALVPAYVFVSPGKDSTGVEDIEMVETEAPAQYYNLNGVEVKAGNLVPGIYIVRQGNKVSKQFIR